jgi:hypothetical protein
MIKPALLSALSAGLLAAPLFGQTVLFQDNFSTTSLGGTTDNWNVYRNSPFSATRFVEVKNTNSEALFGEANNNYLHLFKGEAATGSVWVTASNRFSSGSTVVTVEFDFFFPDRTGVFVGNPDPRIRLGINDPIASNAVRVPGEFRFGQGGTGGISSVADVFSPDTTHRIRIVYNHSNADVEYAGRNLLSSSYHVWIDDSFSFASASLSTGGFLALNTPITSIGFGALTNSDGEMFIDNMVVYAGAIPEPSTYAFFAGLLALGGALVWRCRRVKA